MTTFREPIWFTGPIAGSDALPTKSITDKRAEKHRRSFDETRSRVEPRPEKQQQAQDEFGASSTISSVLRAALADYIVYISDRYIAGRLNGLLLRIKGCSENPSGRRTLTDGLMTARGRAQLLEFSFRKGRKLSANIRHPFHIDLAEGTATMKNVIPAQDFNFPKGASMIGLQLLLVRLDVERKTCTLGTSDAALFGIGDRDKIDIRLEADVPAGNGILLGLLFTGYCYMQRDMVRWSPRQENTMAFVGLSPTILPIE